MSVCGWMNSKCQRPYKAKLYNARIYGRELSTAGLSGLTKMFHLQLIIAHFLHLTSCPSLSSDPFCLNLPSVLITRHSKIIRNMSFFSTHQKLKHHYYGELNNPLVRTFKRVFFETLGGFKVLALLFSPTLSFLSKCNIL